MYKWDQKVFKKITEQGFVDFGQQASPVAVLEAVKKINNLIGSEGLDRALMKTFSDDTFFPDHRNDPVFKELIRNVEVDKFFKDALGDLPCFGDPQITLRFPNGGGNPHLDGFYGKNEDPAQIPNAVLGIYLSDVDTNDGPFTMWPNGFSKTKAWLKGLGAVPKISDHPKSIINSLIKKDGQSITGPAGTAFLCHGLMPHTNLEHKGSHIRYAIFTRIHVKSNNEDKVGFKNRLLNCWKDPSSAS